MPASIPTHDALSLAILIALVLSSAGAPALSAYAGALLTSCGVPISRSLVYAMTLALLGSTGLVLLGADLLLSPLWHMLPLNAGATLATIALAMAPAVGLLAYTADIAIGRRIIRSTRPTARQVQPPHTSIAASSPWQRATPSMTRPPATRTEPLRHEPPQLDPPWLLSVIGAGEELAIRAILVTTSGASLAFLPITAALVTVWFAAIHVRFGAAQFWQKLPLSIGATLLLMMGGVIPAALAHALFNIAAARRLRTLAGAS
ncbi:CBS domain containing-hemolysin-like protein [Peteryoungia aggregata LMG 23059]|uniref:CBS domain containing-hemolysin-like protein n=1 Tax=Peteryoungia aggregata LMG 23059 TaxID=1368425 RepID=A0ABU0G2D6_9HYPH|nr:CPBP family glutamic-type intramembrane protease [Peteryoungia aggregata]MDQ0419494.1 CBS domain containing-hemolysin-like protein [Peteryoungia aggregata LMG 23059]